MSVSLFQSAVGMFGYMTDLHTVDETATETIEADGICHRKSVSINFHFHFAGHDLQSLLFKFLDEFLFLFSAEPFFIPKVNNSLYS